MRGKALTTFTRATLAGIPPAYAGKRSEKIFSDNHLKDHPRLCGEKFPFCLPYDAYQGSPPPMRGKADRC